MKDQKKSKSLFVIGIITLCLVVVFVVWWVLQWLFLASEGVGMVDYINNVQLKQITDYFQFGSEAYDWSTLWENPNLLAGYLTLIVFVILLIVSIVMACVKKNGWVMLGILPVLVLTAGVFDMAGTAEVNGFMSFIVSNINNFSDGTIGALAFSYNLVYQVVYALGCVFAIVFWIMCLVRTCKGHVVVTDEEVEFEEELETEEENPFDEYTDTEEVEPEPIPLFVTEPEPEVDAEEVAPAAPVEEVAHAEEPSTCESGDIVERLKEVVRETVKEELANCGTGEPRPVSTTFGGPLVVQYFNGPVPTGVVAHHHTHHEGGHEHHEGGVAHEGSCDDDEHHPCEEWDECSDEDYGSPIVVNIYTNGETAITQDDQLVAIGETPVVTAETHEEKKVVKPAPVVETTPDVVSTIATVDDSKIVRIPFQQRIVTADAEMKDNYNVLKNTILSYGVKSRVSNSGDTFRLHRKTYIKITIAGKSLKLYYALDPRDYAESTIPVQDAGDIAIYQEIPLVFKVRSPLSLRRAIVLINELMEKNDLEQGEVHSIDWVKRIAQEQK
ncbi:MAG: hypothetical protein LUC16_02820 [Coprobacillus sp.]|nr:hypothetical protein [Coprobacillus sp.]